jgi:succinate dehydrogenase / fumarate reductase membrane anchor subunit
MTTSIRKVKTPQNYESVAWVWMRYSGIALIPLVWIHVLIQDVLVGVHAIDIDYVVFRWANIGWQVYDILLLAFAFAHGMNGLRQVATDFIHEEKAQRRLNWLLFGLWLLISAIGAVAILAAASKNLAGV